MFRIPEPQRLQLIDSDGLLDLGPSLESFRDPFRTVSSGDTFIVTIEVLLRLRRKMLKRGTATCWRVAETERQIAVIEVSAPRRIDMTSAAELALVEHIGASEPIAVTIKWLEWRKPVTPRLI